MIYGKLQKFFIFCKKYVTPYVLGDIDFTEYFNGNKKWYEAVNDSECEGARLVVKTFEDIYVLKDGDSFEMNEEEEMNGYSYYVYSSKVTASLDVPDELKDVLDISKVDKD